MFRFHPHSPPSSPLSPPLSPSLSRDRGASIAPTILPRSVLRRFVAANSGPTTPIVRAYAAGAATAVRMPGFIERQHLMPLSAQENARRFAADPERRRRFRVSLKMPTACVRRVLCCVWMLSFMFDCCVEHIICTFSSLSPPFNGKRGHKGNCVAQNFRFFCLSWSIHIASVSSSLSCSMSKKSKRSHCSFDQQ